MSADMGRPSTRDDSTLLPSWSALTLASMAHSLPCASAPSEWFSDDADAQKKAAGHCRGCPVLDACLHYALDADERYGVWGGMTETERKRERRRRKHAANRQAA